MVWGRPKAAPEGGLSLARRLLEGSGALERDPREMPPRVPARQSYRGHNFELAVLDRDEDRSFTEGGGVVHCAISAQVVTSVEPATVNLSSEYVRHTGQVQRLEDREGRPRITSIAAGRSKRLLCQRGLDGPFLPPYLVDERGQCGIVGVFLTKATQRPAGLVKISCSHQRLGFDYSLTQPSFSFPLLGFESRSLFLRSLLGEQARNVFTDGERVRLGRDGLQTTTRFVCNHKLRPLGVFLIADYIWRQ